MKKWRKEFKRAVAVTLAVLMVSDAVDLFGADSGGCGSGDIRNCDNGVC